MNTELRQLTPNWMKFCAEYARTLKLCDSCKVSRLNVQTAKDHLHDPIVQEEILKFMQQIITVANVDKGMVLHKLHEFTESDIADIYDDFGGYLPIQAWPKHLRQQVVSLETEPLTGRILKVRFVDKLKTVALLGKHVDVGAFEERVKHTHDVSDRLAERISAGRKRAMMDIPAEVVVNE